VGSKDWITVFLITRMRFIFIGFYLIRSVQLLAQSTSVWMEEGLRYEQEFKLEEALKKYELILKSEPDHLQALIHASRMTSNIAGRIPDKEERREKLKVAEEYAQRAIKLNPSSADAHFSLIVTLGLQSEIAPGPKEKVKDAKLLRSEAEKIIQIDSKYALAYFVLGKWHYEVAKLNWFERTACDLFFGGLPNDVSMTEAIKNFRIALSLDPNQIIILYGQASALHYEGKDEEAIRVLEKAMRLPIREPDDAFRKEKCNELMKEIIK
jgi:tetratricopeptide (TPR) repeat protein